ncbi:MAG: ATP-binding protein [Bacteroidales bacterium]|nr:ATP-binding protein [Bacteroidales bacterium]MBR6161411.1 ATP-binding protein [Bacteroidales bacterium]
MEYIKRIADELLELQLEAAGIVLIEGAKWCGKTTSALQQAKSVLFMDDPERKNEYLRIAESDIKVLLEGSVPRLIDEWQKAPQFWDACRYIVDRRGEEGQFILTGSAEPADQSKISHTGTGRVGWVKMRPMTLYESGESNGSVSIGDLFDDNFKAAEGNVLDLKNLCYLICRGGWPKAIGKSERAALRQAFNYVDAVAKREITEVDEVHRSENNTRRLLRSYARHQATQASNSAIAADLATNDTDSLNETTIASYLNALRKIFVIEDMEAWYPNLRSKAAIRTTSTRYFVDPSVATASLGIGPNDLMKDLNTLGLFFETMAVRDLRVYTEALDGNVFHYRDNNGLECDSVLHLRNGHYGLVEIKLGGETLINEGAANLLKLSKKIDTDRMYPPSFMMVLTGTGQYAYQREDGVLVVPIGCLKN